jgi:hypothetical protein
MTNPDVEQAHDQRSQHETDRGPEADAERGLHVAARGERAEELGQHERDADR